MGNTYYGYAQREAAEQVDWSGVARKFTTMLDDEVTAKQEREAALDQSNTDLATLLNTAPSSENKELHNWILDYANNASNYSLMLHRSVKNGNMSTKQYTNAMNNLTAGTNQAIAIANKYNDFFIEQEKRRKEGKLPAKALYEGSIIQEFADFNNTALYIDPITMKVSQGKTVTKNIQGEDVRTLSENTGDFKPVSTLLGWMGETYDKFDMTGAVDNIAGNMAVSYQALNTEFLADGTKNPNFDPRISGEDNVRLNENYDKAMDNYIASYLQDPRNVSSILADYAGVAPNGEAWDFTTDNKKKGDNIIYLSPNNNGGYDIDLDTDKGRELQKLAGEVLKGAVDVKLPRKITMAETVDTKDFNYKDATEEEILGARNVKAFLQVGYGSNEERAAGIAHLKGANEGIVDIVPTDDRKGINVITIKDDVTSTEYIPFNADARLFLDGSAQVVGPGVSIGNSLNYLQNTDPAAFNKFIVGQTVTDDDSPIVRELPEGRTTANVPKVINYNEIQINTGEWKKKVDAQGNEVDTETPVTAKPLEILETAIGIGDDIRLKDRDIKRLDDVVIGITKVVDGLNIGSLNDTNAVVTVIDDDKQNDANRDLESYLTGDNQQWLVGGASSIQIYYPELMSGPIFIPDQGSSESKAKKTASLIDDVYATLVNAENEGRRLAPNDFSFIRNDNQMKDYNKSVYDWAEKNDTFKDTRGNKFAWNDGLGLEYDDRQYRYLPTNVKQVFVNGEQVLIRQLENGKFEMVEEYDFNSVNSQGAMSKYNNPTGSGTTDVITIEMVQKALGDRYVAERDAMEIKYPITDPKADYADGAAYDKFIDEQMIAIAKNIGVIAQ